MQMRGPNAWVVAAFAAALGASIGGGTAALEATMRPWRVGDFGPSMLQPPSAEAPQADAPETTHAFGTMAERGRRARTSS
jgi:hypothetical protein